MANSYTDIVKTCLDSESIKYWKEWKVRSSACFENKVKHNDSNTSIFLKVANDRRQNIIGLNNLPVILTEKNFWEKLVVCLASSQSSSGENSVIQHLACANHPLLDPSSQIYKYEIKVENDPIDVVERYVLSVNATKGKKKIRYTKKLSSFILESWIILFKYGWIKFFLSQLNFVYSKIPYLTCEEVRANELLIISMLKILPGVGPKQARNILQYLGISQKVIPIDSRWCGLLEDRRSFSKNPDENFLKIINKIKSKDIAQLLQQENNYCILEEFLLSICMTLDVEPYLLDAMMFSSHRDKT